MVNGGSSAIGAGPAAAGSPPRPLLSVIIPCRNEVATIRRVLDDLEAQTFAGRFEVVVADGRSDDGTGELLARLVAEAPFRFALVVVDNPRRHIPGGLNAAVAAARGEHIIRVDGHCRLEPTYLAEMAVAFRDGGHDVIGPRLAQVAGGPGLVAGTIALLLATPFGTGGTPSRGRLGRTRQVAHTVMSCYRRDVWERVGGYDERLGSNEDFDFDYRANRAGMRVASLPRPTFHLLARATLVGLARQRWRYGWWKAAVATKFPGSLHLRQILPLVAVVAAPPLDLVMPGVFAALVAIYLVLAMAAAATAGWRGGIGMPATLAAMALAPLVFGIVHGFWALGLIAGLVGNRYRGPRPAPPQARVNLPSRQLPGAPRVAVVHEWLETWGGSEAVLAEILRVLPEADLFVLVDFRDPRCEAGLAGRLSHRTWIQRLPLARRAFRWLYPLFPLAIERLPLAGYDLVISSSHAVAKGVITAPHQLHVCYCHSPMRYAWDQEEQYTRRYGPGLFLLRPLFHYLRLWDLAASARVDRFLANSRFVARRIRKFYHRRAEVLPPPVEVPAGGGPAPREDWFLVVTRLVPYKRVDLLVEAFNGMPDLRLVVVGEGPEMGRLRRQAGPNVEIAGHLPTERVHGLLSRCAAFVFAAEEDFGIVLVEAMARGAPVIAFGRGGAAELVEEGRTGFLFPRQDAPAIREAVRRFIASRGAFDHAAGALVARDFAPERFRERLLAALARALHQHQRP